MGSGARLFKLTPTFNSCQSHWDPLTSCPPMMIAPRIQSPSTPFRWGPEENRESLQRLVVDGRQP
jgi:hypothetical protein